MIMQTIMTRNENDMLAFGAALVKAIEAAKSDDNKSLLFFLHGLLGAGKTTLVRGFLRGLGFSGKVKSPTYTLVEPYEIKGKHIFHFDLYRINDADELTYLGIEDYFDHAAICFVEWPERGEGILPQPDLDFFIEFEGEHKRKIKVEAHSERGKLIKRNLD